MYRQTQRSLSRILHFLGKPDRRRRKEFQTRLGHPTCKFLDCLKQSLLLEETRRKTGVRSALAARRKLSAHRNNKGQRNVRQVHSTTHSKTETSIEASGEEIIPRPTDKNPKYSLNPLSCPGKM